MKRGFIRSYLFHFGTLPIQAHAPLLWVALGFDKDKPGEWTSEEGARFLNVTIAGRFIGRVYEKRFYGNAARTEAAL